MRDLFIKLFAIDFRALKLLRVSMAVYLLYYYFCHSRILSYFVGPGAIVPELRLEESISLPVWLHFLSDSMLFQYSILALSLSLAVLLLFGVWHKWVALLCWYLLSSFQFRMGMNGDFSEDLARVMIFWLAFMSAKPEDHQDSSQVSLCSHLALLNFATAAFLLQVFFVFFVAGITKFQGELWTSGRALEIVLQDQVWPSSLGTYLLQYPHLLKFFSYLIPCAEAVIPFFLFLSGQNQRIRHMAVFLLGLFALFLFFFMDLHAIPFVLIIALIPFLSGKLLPQALSVRVRSGESVDLRARPVFHPFRLGAAFQFLFVSVLLVYTVMGNIHEIQSRQLLPPRVMRLMAAFGMGQGWWMFSPDPFVHPGFFRLHILLEGQEHKILIVNGSASRELPHLASFWTNYHLKNLLYNKLSSSRPGEDFPFFLSWVCKQYALSEKEAERVSASYQPFLVAQEPGSTLASLRCSDRLLDKSSGRRLFSAHH